MIEMVKFEDTWVKNSSFRFLIHIPEELDASMSWRSWLSWLSWLSVCRKDAKPSSVAWNHRGPEDDGPVMVPLERTSPRKISVTETTKAVI